MICCSALYPLATALDAPLVATRAAPLGNVRSSAKRYPRCIGVVYLLCMTLSIGGCAGSLARLPSQHFDSQSTTTLSSHTVEQQALHAFSTTTSLHRQPGPSVALERHESPTDPVQARVNIDAVNAPLDALLHALATEVDVQLLQSGQLNERVTLKLEQQSLGDALEQLSEQAGFGWELSDDRLTIHAGAAYVFSYPIDYLNIDRRTQSSVGLATRVGTINAGDAGGQSVANSSQTRIENLSEHHFWESLLADVDNVLGQGGQHEFTINREAGLLTAYATPVGHHALRHYLKRLHDSASRQVLIEATVVEVALSDSFETGVDWQLLSERINGISAVQSLVGAPPVNAQSIGRVVAPAGLVSLVQAGGQGTVQATLSLLEQFGDVRILSRPRIIALNNQPSVLKVVDNRVYFTVNIERRQSEIRDEVVTETQIHTVPVGLVMNVTPQISRDGAVMLNVRPTLSRILGFVNDPNPELAEANVRNGVPEIQVREMESMLRVQSGNMAIIGGLMQETREQNDSGLPGLDRLPLLGKLFSRRGSRRRQTELLIVLRPTVISADTTLVAER